jgi:hypothetical protein
VKRRFALRWYLFLVLTVLPWPLRAEPPKTPSALPSRNAETTLEGKHVLLGVSFRDVVDAEISKKLASGLPTVIVLRAWLFRDGGSDPIAMTAKTCKIVYDLWDEVYKLQITQPGGQTDSVAVNQEGVLRQCAEAKKLRLVERNELDGNTRFFVAALVEVNPLSQETLDRIKRWVTRPNGSAPASKGDSLFGSFVGLFVTRINDADRKLSFRTQAFFPPNAPPEKK